ncbi:hypothetical protein B0J17DRAFT_720417 [Rhizoctonia solani]|nr:hypothetical protein B0J17DRAFT_720417 [Rhizoctonia solani]
MAPGKCKETPPARSLRGTSEPLAFHLKRASTNASIFPRIQASVTVLGWEDVGGLYPADDVYIRTKDEDILDIEVVNEPERPRSEGKYPLIATNGCLTLLPAKRERGRSPRATSNGGAHTMILTALELFSCGMVAHASVLLDKVERTLKESITRSQNKEKIFKARTEECIAQTELIKKAQAYEQDLSEAELDRHHER